MREKLLAKRKQNVKVEPEDVSEVKEEPQEGIGDTIFSILTKEQDTAVESKAEELRLRLLLKRRLNEGNDNKVRTKF